MKKKHTFHRENCTNRVRLSFNDAIGRTIILTGIHAFEWQINIITDNTMISIRFANRQEATKEFNKYKRKRC